MEAISLSAGLLTFVFCFSGLDMDAIPSLVPSCGATISLWLGFWIARLRRKSNVGDLKCASEAFDGRVRRSCSLPAPRHDDAPSNSSARYRNLAV
jgi:hypothetical protein